MLPDNLNHTINFWIAQLQHYSFNQLCAKPAPQSWSLGQMYMHLISDTNFYIDQINECIKSNDNATEEATAAGKTMLLNNSFPDEIIEGNPANAYLPQPNSKEQLTSDLHQIKLAVQNINKQIINGAVAGKTKHPGLGYFGVNDWLQFADMHFRHHLRQKKRIDDFLLTQAF